MNSNSSSADFNPYHKWLGISGATDTPDHYRLLGIESFESDPDVIASAADRQMAHLRKYQAGPHAALSQQILNEIAKAKVCLLNDEKKRKYDSSLQPTRVSPLAAVPSPKIHVQSQPRPRRQQEAKRSLLLPGLIVCSIAIAAFAIATRSFREEPAPETTLNAAEPVEATPGSGIGEPENPDVDVAIPGEDKEETAPRNTRRLDANFPISPAQAAAANGTHLKPPVTSPPLAPAVEIRNTEVTRQFKDLISPPSPSNVTAESDRVPETPGKTPVPDRSALSLAKKQLDLLIKKSGLKRPLRASKLLPLLDHESVRNSPTARYALLTKIRNLEISGGTVAAAWDRNVQIADEFDVDYDSTRTETISQLTRNIKNNPLGQAQLISKVHEEMWSSLRQSDFDAALRMAQATFPIARNIGDKATIKWARNLERLVQSVESRYHELEAERETLEIDPSNEAANESTGRYLCFLVGDFDKGLPYLSKGPAGELKSLAIRETGGRIGVAQQKSLADDWWSLAARMPEDAAHHIRSHAANHYRETVFKITLPERKQVWSRLAELSYDQLHTQLSLIVGTTWKVSWDLQPPWDRVEFLQGGKCKILSQKKELPHSWQLQSTKIIVLNEHGTRAFTLTPVSDSQLHCEKHETGGGRLMASGVGFRLQ